MALNPLTSASSSDSQRMSGALAFAMRAFQVEAEGLLPAVVINYDRANNVVSLKPLITWIDVNGNAISRFQIDNVQVLSLGAGNFHVNFPIRPGDLGWIFSSDRDLTAFKQTLAESKPNSGRIHQFASGAIFIPDVMRKYTIDGEDAANMVIQSVDAKTKISLGATAIKVKAPSLVTIDSPQTTMTGNCLIQGTLTVSIDAIVNGISVVNHGHISSSPGSRTSGGMIT